MTISAADYAGKVTVCDGAWGTELDKLGCPAGYCREKWNLEKPELVEKVPSAYVFFRYTFRPTFSSLSGTLMFPSVEAMMMVFPDDDGPNSFARSTLMVRMLPSTDISTFFILFSLPEARYSNGTPVGDLRRQPLSAAQ